MNQPLDDLLDRLVEQYDVRLRAGRRGETSDLLAQVPEAQRASLRDCFALMETSHQPDATAPAPLAPGLTLGGYRLRRPLGRGGMALVFEAEQVTLSRRVAIKVLRSGLAQDRRHVERFRREAQAMARLDHPHLVEIFEVDEDHGHTFIAMELIDGPSLAQVLEALPTHRPWGPDTLAELTGDAALANAPHPDAAMARMLAPAARAVAAAHAAGVLHRDLKPANLLFGRDGRLRVADFGLAKGDDDPALSLTGEPLGTPYYMSPEVVAHQTHVDARADVYSLGVTLYEALAGRRPFEGDSAFAVFDAIRAAKPAALRSERPATTEDAEEVVLKAMAHHPHDRYPSMAAFADDLEALGEGQITNARRTRVSGWSRLRADLTHMNTRGVDFRSRRVIRGRPLVHVHVGPPNPDGSMRHAKGWLAIGHRASGLVALGAARATGVVALAGGMATGGLTLAGGLSLGVVSFGGLAAGLLALGGAAVGGLAAGGAAVGLVAIGGYALGWRRLGGNARDDELLEWLERVGSWF